MVKHLLEFLSEGSIRHRRGEPLSVPVTMSLVWDLDPAVWSQNDDGSVGKSRRLPLHWAERRGHSSGCSGARGRYSAGCLLRILVPSSGFLAPEMLPTYLPLSDTEIPLELCPGVALDAISNISKTFV